MKGVLLSAPVRSIVPKLGALGFLSPDICRAADGKGHSHIPRIARPLGFPCCPFMAFLREFDVPLESQGIAVVGKHMQFSIPAWDLEIWSQFLGALTACPCRFPPLEMHLS